jgi:hypothetical protein
VTVLTMAGADADDDFSDEVHPKPRVTGAWAQRLAAVLNAADHPPRTLITGLRPESPLSTASPL